MYIHTVTGKVTSYKKKGRKRAVTNQNNDTVDEVSTVQNDFEIPIILGNILKIYHFDKETCEVSAVHDIGLDDRSDMNEVSAVHDSHRVQDRDDDRSDTEVSLDEYRQNCSKIFHCE